MFVYGRMESRTCVLALSLAAASLAAQQAPTARGIPAVVANLSPIPRADVWVSFTVPDVGLPRGPAEFAPAGWPVVVGDKVGPKARLVHVRVKDLRASAHVRGTIRAAESPLEVPLPTGDGAVGDPQPTLIVQLAGATVRWRPGHWETVETGVARTVVHGWGRVPGTQLVANVWYYVYTAARTIPFELLIVNCDPRTENFVQALKGVALETQHGVWPAIDFHLQRGGTKPVRVGSVLRTRLLGEDWLGHGQGLAWRGALIVWKGYGETDVASLRAEVHGPVVGQAMNWQGHWGPWGVTPDLHPSEATPRRGYGAWAVRELRAKVGRALARHGSIWDRPLYGSNRKPSDTGDQQDFGVTKLAPALSPRNGNPFHIWELGHSVLWEAGRPSWYYEADGRPLDPAKHPNLVFWGLLPHWNTKVSPDRLGKKPGGKTRFQGRMMAKDWAHMSSNNLAGWTILTGSWLGRHLCRQEIVGWLLGSRLDRGLGTARGVGRSMLATTWNYLATGDPRVRRRLRERFEYSFNHFLDPERSNWQVRILTPYAPDGRNLGGRWWTWMPWQEALAIVGIDAANKIAKHPKADEILQILCRSLVHYGWWKHANGRWVTGINVRYLTGDQEGTALSPAQYSDPGQASPHYGTSFDVWNWGALLIALRIARQGGDKETARRAQSILTQLRQERRARPAPVGFDRASEWKAVR